MTVVVFPAPLMPTNMTMFCWFFTGMNTLVFVASNSLVSSLRMAYLISLFILLSVEATITLPNFRRFLNIPEQHSP